MRLTNIALAAAAVAGVTAIDTIKIKDRHWVTSSGKDFFIKGLDYQPGGSAKVGKGNDWDPLVDPEKCARDIILFQKLKVNTIRVYSVDPTKNHDECMTMLAAAGIYLVLDVNSPLPNQHLHATEPWTTYNEFYLEHIFTVMEAFAGYDNLLAFLSGNEVIHTPGSEEHAPNYIKAVTRDMKAYSKKHLKRQIPIGYSNADNIEFRVSLSRWMECGNEGNVDFFGVNSYQWCGSNTFKGSGYDKLVEHFQNYSLPVFFSEYGCIDVRPRKWEETTALYSEDMTGVFSGGLVYEYSLEENEYGIVELKDNGDAHVIGEFEALEKVMAEIGDVKVPSNVQKNTRPQRCGNPNTFYGITVSNTLPKTLGQEFIDDGIDAKKFHAGSLLDEKAVKTETKYKLFRSNGKAFDDATIDTSNAGKGGSKKDDDDSAAGVVKVAFGFTSVVAVLASMLLM